MHLKVFLGGLRRLVQRVLRADHCSKIFHLDLTFLHTQDIDAIVFLHRSLPYQYSLQTVQIQIRKDHALCQDHCAKINGKRQILVSPQYDYDK